MGKSRELSAYYCGFTPTGCGPIDEILAAVARAGRLFHSVHMAGEPDQCANPGFIYMSYERSWEGNLWREALETGVPICFEHTMRFLPGPYWWPRKVVE